MKTLERTVVWSLTRRVSRRQKKAALGPGADSADGGKLPRVTRLMALALKFEQQIREGLIRDYADLARLGLVTRARATQLMNLLNLAPDIQEDILFLPRTVHGRDPVTERGLRQLCRIVDWNEQRLLWRVLRVRVDSTEVQA